MPHMNFKRQLLAPHNVSSVIVFPYSRLQFWEARRTLRVSISNHVEGGSNAGIGVGAIAVILLSLQKILYF